MLSQKNGLRIKTGESSAQTHKYREDPGLGKGGEELYEIAWHGEGLPGIEVARKPAFPFVWLEPVLKNGNEFEGTIRVWLRKGGKPSLLKESKTYASSGILLDLDRKGHTLAFTKR